MNRRRSTSRALASRARPLAAASLAMGSLLSLSGCGALLEDDVTPEQRALEIIVSGGAAGDVGCEVNYDEVGVGTHPVSVIAESGPATVRILSRAGTVVFERNTGSAAGDSTPPGPEEESAFLPESAGAEVRLEAGRYRVECESGGSVSTASLRVEPAAPVDRE